MSWLISYDDDEPFLLIDYVGGKEKCLVSVRKNAAGLIVPFKEVDYTNLFLFMEVPEGRNYHLTLNIGKGLRQMCTSQATLMESPDSEIIAHLPDKTVGRGSYQDYRVVAHYACERFQEISHEISSSDKLVLPYGGPEGYKNAVREISDWDAFQRELCGVFIDNFSLSFRGAGLSLDQVGELERIVRPLIV